MKQDNIRKGSYNTSKLLYRRRITIKALERYGIERGDTAILAMDGDVQLHDLGYFSIKHWGLDYDQFRLVCERDSTCFKSDSDTDESDICLRTDQKKCEGIHAGQPYGRIVEIQRNGKPVETSLTFRPFDERESLLLREQNQLPTAPTLRTSRANKLILTPRALNAHATKTFQKAKAHWRSQPDLASQVAAILASPNTPAEVRDFLKKSMRLWAEATDAVNTPELAREAFIAMNRNTKLQDDFKREQRKATEREYRAFYARLAVVDTALMVSHAEKEGKRPTINEAMRDSYMKLKGIEQPDDTEEMPEVIAPHLAPVVDLLCWKQSHPRPIKTCVVRVE